jgi:hypothetical protein
MMASETELAQIMPILVPVLGRPAWNVFQGTANSIWMNFGHPVTKQGLTRAYTRGEWALWTRYGQWRLEEAGRVVCGSSDPASLIQVAVTRLEGLSLRAVDLLAPAVDAAFRFDGDALLRVFCTRAEEDRSWQLYAPDGFVLGVGPAGHWSYESASLPPQGYAPPPIPGSEE